MKGKTGWHTQEKSGWITIADWLVRASIISVVFLVPLLYFGGRAVPFITSKTYFLQGAVAFGVVLWSWLAVYRKEYRFSKRALQFLGIPFLLLSVLTISGAVGVDPLTSFFGTYEKGTGLIFLWHCFGLLVLVASIVSVYGEKFIAVIARATLASSVVLAVTTFFSDGAFVREGSFLSNSVGGGLLGNSSFVGAYFVFSVFLGLWLVFTEASRIKRWLAGLLLLPIILSPVIFNVSIFKGAIAFSDIVSNPLVVVGSSRMATLSILVGLFVSSFFYLAFQKGNTLKRVLGVAGLAIFLFLGIYSGTRLFNANSSIHNVFVEETKGTRFIFWEAALSGIRERPLLGWGPENYRLVIQKHFNPRMLEETYSREVWVDRPHNAVLEMFVNGGVVGGVMFLVFIVWIIGSIIWLRRRDRISSVRASLLLGLVVAYILQNQIFFDGVASYMMLFVLVGIIIGLSVEERVFERTNNPRLAPFLAGGISLLIILLWVFCTVIPTQKAKEAADVISVNLEISPDKNNEYSKLVTSFGSYSVVPSMDFFSHELFQYYHEREKEIFSNKEQGLRALSDIEGMISGIEASWKYTQRNYRLALSASRLQNLRMLLKEDFSEDSVLLAKKYGEQGMLLSPRDPQIYLSLAETYIYSRDIEKARSLISQAIALNPNLQSSYLLKIQLERFFGTQEALEAAIREARARFLDLVVE